MARHKKGDISMTTIFVLVIGLASILLLIGLFSAKLPSFGKGLYCKTLFHVFGSSAMPSGIRQSQSFCQESAVVVVAEARNETMHLTFFAGDMKTLAANFSARSSYVFQVNITGIQPKTASMQLSSIDGASGVRLILGAIAIDIPVLNQSNSPYIIDTPLFLLLNSTYAACPKADCTATFSMGGTSGKTVIHGLDVEYPSCNAADAVLAHMLACWERSGQGRLSKDLACFTLSVPEGCRPAGLDEKSISELMASVPGVCESLGNSDYGCGEKDLVDWTLSGFSGNVLIQYRNRRIVVS